MSKSSRNSTRYEGFELFSEYLESLVNQDFRSVEALSGFTQKLAEHISRAAENPNFLYGQRTEAMFESVAISLGHIRMIKKEDSGRFWNTGDRIQPPDYRVILHNGDCLFIEVKNCFQSEHEEGIFRIEEHRVASIKEYSTIHNTPLLIAIYWVVWGMWTLVTFEDFQRYGKKWGIRFTDAVKRNRMATLGDAFIATTPPLKLRFKADLTKYCGINESNELNFTIGEVALFCGDRVVTDARDRRLVSYLILHGRWEATDPSPLLEGGVLQGVEFAWWPGDREGISEHQPFSMVGTLSGMYSIFYRGITSDHDGRVMRINVDTIPGLLQDLIPEPGSSDAVPLWLFRQSIG